MAGDRAQSEQAGRSSENTPEGGASPSLGGGAAIQRHVQRRQSREIRDLLGGPVQRKGGGDTSAVHAAAARGVAGGGGPLPHLDAIQQSFGAHDVSGVQAHVGGAAAEASQAMGAEAYATGDQVAFSQSPDLHTAAHEAAHTVQQRQGVSLKGGVGEVGDPYERQADAVADRVVAGQSAEDLLGPVSSGGGTATQQKVQRKSIADQVTDLLSYGALDWAVTDEEATNALRLLAPLDLATRRTTIAAIGRDMIDRLIDNLPDSARQTKAFADLLIAMGPARVRAHIDELLSYGFFDWAITDAEANEVFRMIGLLPAADQTRVVSGMTAQMRARFVDNLPNTTVIDQSQHDALRRFFDATPDAEITTLMKLMALRFNVEVDTDGANWDKTVLRRSWDVLKMLPAAHVAANTHLSRLLLYAGSSISGYANSAGDAAMTTGGQNVDTTVETGSFTNPGDPLFGVNLWDTTLRHEVGHRVDPQVNATDGYCKTAPGGNWEYWDGTAGVAEKMVTQSAGTINGWADAAQKTQIIGAFQELIDARTFARAAVDTKLGALPFFANRATDAAQQTAWTSMTTDNVYVVFPTISSSSGPWNTTPTVTLNGRFFQEAYSWGKWVAYDVSARSKQVSNYQFRSPGEWFAEAYAAYYDPSGTSKGALLTSAGDAATKTWMDNNVDPAGGAGSVDPTTQVG